MPASFGSTIATAMLFTKILGLVTHPHRQNGSINLDTALGNGEARRRAALDGGGVEAVDIERVAHHLEQA